MLICIYTYVFGHILDFFNPPFLYLGEEHVSWSICSHKWHVFAFFFFYVLPRASYGNVWCGFIPSVAWRFSNYYFQLLKCRNLTLNSFFFYFSLEAGMFHSLGASVHPTCLYAPYILCPYIWMPQCPHMFNQPPYVPNAPLCICMFEGISACDGDVGPSLFLDNHHVFGCLPMCPTPHTFICSPACLYVLGATCIAIGETPHVGGLGGCQHICQALGVCQYIHWLSIILHLVPFLLLIMSRVSTSMVTTTTPLVTMVSSGMSSLSLVTMATSSMELTTILGQHDVVLLPPWHQEALEVFWPCLCVTVSTSNFDALHDFID